MKKINIPPTVKGLTFDCDGTLADTMPLQWEAWHEILAFYGKTCAQDFLEPFKGAPTNLIVAKLNHTFSYTLDPNLFQQKKKVA